MTAKAIEKETWNVLLVSHGGWIRELFGYFLEDNNCSGIPLKRWQVCTPNTGITKFKIGIYGEGEIHTSSVQCMLFQCRRHLDLISADHCKCSKCQLPISVQH